MENPYEILLGKLAEIEQRQGAIETLLQSMQKPQATEQTTEQPISQQEAELFLGKSRQTLTTWRRKGVIKAYKLNGRIYYMRSELVAALQKLS